jgi:hypothetical protein
MGTTKKIASHSPPGRASQYGVSRARSDRMPCGQPW